MYDILEDVGNLVGVSKVIYLGYRVPFKVKGEYKTTRLLSSSTFFDRNSGIDTPENEGLHNLFKKAHYRALLETGRVRHGKVFVVAKLIDMGMLDRAGYWTIDDNHNGAMFMCRGKWFMLVKSDGHYWFDLVENFDESFVL